MTEIERNDYFYVCSLIEYIARETKNHRGYIVECIGQEGIENLLYDAEVNHCLSFEQVCDEVVEVYKIKEGKFDTISECQYDVPSFLDIGKLYSIMIEDCAKEVNEAEELIKIFTSFISDEISDFNTGFGISSLGSLPGFSSSFIISESVISPIPSSCAIFSLFRIINDRPTSLPSRTASSSNPSFFRSFCAAS